MGREQKRAVYGTGPGGHFKERHKRHIRNNMSSGNLVGSAASEAHMRVLNPRPEVPSMKSKHQSYYELVENKDKKKKLELQITSDPEPPPGFEFVPIGNPELTQACKEISREQDAMIFIVSTNKSNIPDSLAHHVNRIGHHIRQTIVEQARETIGESSDDSAIGQKLTGVPEPIPETQQEINEQADKAIRDLFPRIPNTDRQMIIEHSFKKGAHKKGGPLVGLAQDITLSRRVQLAVLAHIRHTHTRYDQLLKETTYINARKAVETLCLDILVKWRGDEETGRDQLDEILREVIVISDSEGEEDGEDDDEHDNTDDEEEEDSSAAESGDAAERPASRESTYSPPPATTPVLARRAPEHSSYRPLHIRPAPAYISSHASTRKRQGVRTGLRGFDRYQAALEARWGEAMIRVRHQEEQPPRADSHAPGPYDLVPRREPSQERYQHSLEAKSYHDSHQFPGHQHDIGYDKTLHGYERKAPRPVAAYLENVRPSAGGRHVPQAYAYKEPRVPDAPPHIRGPSETFRPHNNFDQPIHVQRHTVSSEQARDYLVPSIEPSAPPSRVRPPSPQRGHAASPYNPAFYTLEATEDTAHGRPNKRNSPTWPSDGYASTKRRRFVGDETITQRGSPSQKAFFHHRPMREERDILSSRAYAGDETYANASRPSPYGALPPNLQSLPAEHPSVQHGGFHSDAGLIPIGDQSRPIVVEDWENRASPNLTTFPVHTRREEPVARRTEFAAEIRRDLIRPSIENRRSMSREYSTSRRPERDHFARYRAVHEISLAGSKRDMESGADYCGTQNTPSNAKESMPLGYRRLSPPPPSYRSYAGHHNTEPGPVPQYVRETRLQSHPYSTSSRQPSEYEPDMVRRRVGEPTAFHDRQENRFLPSGHPLEEPSYAQYRDRYSQQPPDSGGSRRYYGHPAPSNPPQQQ